VGPGLVVTAVASSAIRLESRELPVDCFGVALMALRTCQVAAVVLRLVRQAGMAIVSGCPGGRAVAQTAILTCIEMPGVLPACGGAVVAGRARAENLVVVHHGHWCPHICAVAVFADVGRLHMRRSLACCVAAIVAARAIVNDIGVVEIRRYPRNGRMAVIAIVAATDVGGMFAGRRGAIVAGVASACYLRVIYRVRRRPEI